MEQNKTWQKIKKKFQLSKSILSETFVEFFKEQSFIHCAALSYYTVLTLVPIIYLGFVSIGKIIGQQTMVEIISSFLSDNIGITDTTGIINFLHTVDFEQGNLFFEIIGFVVIFVSASALFKSLKLSLNEYLDIDRVFDSKRKLIFATIRSRFVSMLMLAFFGFVLVLVYFLQILVISFGNRLFSDDSSLNVFYNHATQHGLAILSNVLIFLLIFKYLHDGEIKWRVAVAGSLFTSILLYFGQLLIKYYLTTYFFARDGGIAGTMLIILVWMYYSSHIIFLGAKFTTVYARQTDRPIVF